MNTIFDSKKLINKYADMIYSISIGYLKNKEDAEDIVQEVFIKYIEHIKLNKKFNDEEHEKCWIIRVTMNLCSNYLKKNKMFSKITIQKDIFYKFDEDENYLLEKIDKLDLNYKTVFELFYFRDLKISEISKILNISKANVKTRLKRARDKIQIYIENDKKIL